MSEVTNLWFQLLTLALAFIALIYAIIGFRKEKVARLNLESKFKATEVLLKGYRKKHESLVKQFNELRAGSVGMSRKVIQLANDLDGLNDRQAEVELNDPDNRLYSRAVRLIELGADLSEVMDECEIPRAEAELLVRLHKQNR